MFLTIQDCMGCAMFMSPFKGGLLYITPKEGLKRLGFHPPVFHDVYTGEMHGI